MGMIPSHHTFTSNEFHGSEHLIKEPLIEFRMSAICQKDRCRRPVNDSILPAIILIDLAYDQPYDLGLLIKTSLCMVSHLGQHMFRNEYLC